MKYNSKEIFDNINKNSVGIDKKDEFNVVRKIIIPVVSIASSLIIFTSLSGCFNNNNIPRDLSSKTGEVITNLDKNEVPQQTTYEEEYNHKVVQDNLSVFTERVRFKFVRNGISMDDIYVNTVEDYKKINNLSDKDIIRFYIYSNYDKIETEKVIVALGYNDWNDFLIKGKYVDENGKPSISVWIGESFQEMYNEIVGKTETNVKRM